MDNIGIQSKKNDYSKVSGVDKDKNYTEDNNEIGEERDDDNFTSINNVTLFISILILILSTIFYMFTLAGCKGTQADCLKDFDQAKVKEFALILLSSAFTFSLNILLYFMRVITWKVPLLHVLIFAFLCFIYDTGTDLASHGSYNRAFLFFFMVPSLILQIICVFIYKAFRRSKVVTSIVLIMIIIAVSIFFSRVFDGSCKNWNDGLKDTKLDMEYEICPIIQPKKCWMNVMDNIFDVSRLLGDDCKQFSFDSRFQMLKHTRIRNAKVVGYPRTENWSFYWDGTLDVFQFKVLSKLIDMEDENVPQTLKDNVETIVDFNKTPVEVTQRVNRDDKVAEERAKIFEEYNKNAKEEDKVLAKNVVFIFIDSLSRDHFRRKLKKTKQLLDDLYENYESDARSYQFLRYHGLAAWTLANMVPVNFGVNWLYKVEGNNLTPKNFLKYYKERGYVTGQTHNYCGKELYDLEKGNLEKFKLENWDHENNVFFCDPNYSIPGHPFSLFNGPYGVKRRCLYSDDSNKYIFNYGKLFWEAYKDVPKFLRIAFLDAHEGTAEVAKYMDEALVNFINFIRESPDFEDTMIVIMADHGVNMPGFYSFIDAEDFHREKTLPSHYWILPKKLADKHHMVLKSNEQKMLTPYDLNNVLLHICKADKSNYNTLGKSFFEEIDDSDRNCFKFNIDDFYCNCADG